MPNQSGSEQWHDGALSFDIAGWAYGPLYGSEDDMSRNVKIFLLSTGIGIVIGAWFGNWVLILHILDR